MKPPNDLPTDQNDPRFQEWFQEAQQKSVGEPPATIVQDLTDLWSNDWFMRFHFFSRWESSDQHSLFEEFSAGRFISEGMNEKQAHKRRQMTSLQVFVRRLVAILTNTKGYKMAFRAKGLGKQT